MYKYSPPKNMEPETLPTKCTVLYVEDHHDNLVLVEKILTYHPNIHFLSASNARMGIELARTHRPDLILMDIHMPEMDGLMAFKKLKEFEETRDIPVVALSADALDFQIQRILNEGFDGYIVKPINVSDFSKTIDRYLHK